MKRRQFVRLIGGAAAAWPAALRAQQSGRRPVIGLLVGPLPLADISGPDPANLQWRAFIYRLNELGWIEGRTVTIERRTAEGRLERAAAILAEFVARRVDVIVVGATDWLWDAARKATRTVPVIALFTEDPVAAGFAVSIARPGGNVVGLTTVPGRALVEKRLEFLKEAAPRIARVAFFGRRSAWESYRSEGGAAALPPVFAGAERPEEFDAAFATVLRERADALLVSHGPVYFFGAPRIAAFAREKGLPTVFPWREAAEAGGLMSYGPVVLGQFRQLAEIVDRILRGAKAAELPIEQPTVFELVLNLKTAKALALTLPQSLLARAEHVIE
jgi:putative ABC transport system substrate-binding protein